MKPYITGDDIFKARIAAGGDMGDAALEKWRYDNAYNPSRWAEEWLEKGNIEKALACLKGCPFLGSKESTDDLLKRINEEQQRQIDAADAKLQRRAAALKGTK